MKKTVKIKRDNVGHWHVILSCDLGELYKPKKVVPMTSKSVGFDFGLSYFLTSSENEQIKSPEFLKQSLEQLKAKSKQLSAKIKTSKNRYNNRRGVSTTGLDGLTRELDLTFRRLNS